MIGTPYGVAKYYDNKIVWDEGYTNELGDQNINVSTPCTHQSKCKDWSPFVPLCVSFKPKQDEFIWNMLAWEKLNKNDRMFFMEHIKLCVAVHLIIINDNQILLQRRYKTGYEDGKYGVVAGHIDGNEQILEAMFREAREEAGIILDLDNTRIVQVMHRKKLMKKELITL